MRVLALIVLSFTFGLAQAKDVTSEELVKWKVLFPELRTILKTHQDDFRVYMENNFDYQARNHTHYSPSVMTEWMYSALKGTQLMYQYQPIAEQFNKHDDERLLMVTHQLMRAIIVNMMGKTVADVESEIEKTRADMTALKNDATQDPAYVKTMLRQYQNAIRALEQTRDQISHANKSDLALVKPEAQSLMQILVGA